MSNYTPAWKAAAEALQPGDVVGYWSYNRPSTANVDRVTKTQVIIIIGGQERRFSKEDGREYGAKTERYNRVTLCTAESVAAYRQREDARHVLSRAQECLAGHPFKSLTLEQCVEVAALLASFDKAAI